MRDGGAVQWLPAAIDQRRLRIDSGTAKTSVGPPAADFRIKTRQERYQA
jgi:hypothetical protein